MLKLYNLYKDVILEAVQDNKIYDAIRKRHRVNITYNDGKDEEATGKRTIEVYLYGALAISDPAGKPAIRAYQIFGDTKTGAPGWKTFLADRIISWEPLDFVFYTPISDRDPDLRNAGKAYREDNADKLFSSVYASADFNNIKYDKKKSDGVFTKDGKDDADKTNVGQVNWGNQNNPEEPQGLNKF